MHPDAGAARKITIMNGMEGRRIAMINIAELFYPYPTRLWQLAKQLGVNHAVSILPYEPPAPEQNAPRSWPTIHGQLSLADVPRDSEGAYPWDYATLSQMKARYAQAGLD